MEDIKASRTSNKFLNKTLKPRNPMHDAEIMRKGGVHVTPKRPKYQKQVIYDQLDIDSEDDYSEF